MAYIISPPSGKVLWLPIRPQPVETSNLKVWKPRDNRWEIMDSRFLE